MLIYSIIYLSITSSNWSNEVSESAVYTKVMVFQGIYNRFSFGGYLSELRKIMVIIHVEILDDDQH
jgi:hypothetical protein